MSIIFPFINDNQNCFMLFLRKKHRQIKITETSVVVDSIEFDLFSEFELKRIEIRSRWIDRSKT